MDYRIYEVTASGAPGYSPLRPIAAHSQHEAAEVAAERLARRLGRRGAVVSLRWDSSTMDGSSSVYQAFIGRRIRDGIEGGNVWIYVARR